MILCSEVLANLPTYFMSIFQVPTSTWKQIEKLMGSFFWKGNSDSKLKHLANWQVTDTPFENGGLSLGGLYAKNKALLTKWGWRYCFDSSSLWRSVIDSIYGSDSFNWQSHPTSNRMLSVSLG